MEKYEQFAPTAAEQLRRWDAGDLIWTIEMGGMGPGYEQAIQVAAIEIVRDEINNPLPTPGDKEANRKWGESTMQRIDQPGNDLGLSGAQFGAARFLAYKWIEIGPKRLMQEAAYKDRHIMASRMWPNAPLPKNDNSGSQAASPEAKKL